MENIWRKYYAVTEMYYVIRPSVVVSSVNVYILFSCYYSIKYNNYLYTISIILGL
jgi:hypothetical protein